jgi:hypothetical protein
MDAEQTLNASNRLRELTMKVEQIVASLRQEVIDQANTLEISKEEINRLRARIAWMRKFLPSDYYDE